jgi:hypothetical protein
MTTGVDSPFQGESMKRLVKVAVMPVAVALALTMTNPQAQAAPRQEPAASTYKVKTIGPLAWNAAHRVQQVISANHSATLDYRVAAAKFRTAPAAHRNNWRRQVGAGWLLMHQPISHISATELAAVKHVLANYRRTTLGVQPLHPVCYGVTKAVVHDPQRSSYFYNSCATNNMKAGLLSCVIAATAVTSMLSRQVPSVAGVTGLVIAACGLINVDIITAQSNSSVQGIIIDVINHGWSPYPYPGHEYVTYRVRSQ